MIEYKRCSEVEIEKVYEAFNIGFSDYIIKMHISLEDFIKRFFGPEGNSLDHSHIALHKEKPIGLILGGIKDYEGIKTIRCGTLAIAPEYRGLGVANNLFQLFKEEGIKNNCKQLFLEVIVGNDRAIKFYENHEFKKVYDLLIYSKGDLETIKDYNIDNFSIKEITLKELKAIVKERVDFHINWQNDIDYIMKSENFLIYGAYIKEALVGALCLSKTGKISFIWTEKQYRNRGVASNLLKRATKINEINKVVITFPNSAPTFGFVAKNRFNKEKIQQYEMYYIL